MQSFTTQTIQGKIRRVERMCHYTTSKFEPDYFTKYDDEHAFCFSELGIAVVVVCLRTAESFNWTVFIARCNCYTKLYE